MPSSAIPACLAVTSWHTVIVGESLTRLIICSPCPSLIRSKLSVYYAPYLLWCWCHFCVSSHRSVTCVISCQQRKKKTVTLLSFVHQEFFAASVNLPFGICHLSSICGVPLSFGLSSFFSGHQLPLSLQSFSKCVRFYPLMSTSIYSFMSLTIFLCSCQCVVRLSLAEVLL